MMEATQSFSENTPNIRDAAVTTDPTTIQRQPPAMALEPIPADPEAKRLLVFQTASKLFEKKPDWVTFYREILGKEGLARHVFPTLEQMAEFEKTIEYAEIQAMLATLRSGNTPVPSDDDEPTRVITVRLPKSLHEALRAEAHERKTSMNKLCISKLLQLIDQQLVPHE